VKRASAAILERGCASADGAALLERASAPSRPEQRAQREQRAGVASREREEWRAVELALALPNDVARIVTLLTAAR